MKTPLIMAAMVLGLAAAPAQAADFTINFASGNSSASNSLTYSTSGLSVVVSGWTVNSSGVVTNGRVQTWSGGGLGVISDGEPGTSPTHTIDNLGGAVDFVVMQFNQAVNLRSATLNIFDSTSPYNTCPASGCDGDAMFYYGSAAMPTTLASLTTAINDKSYGTLNGLLAGSFTSPGNGTSFSRTESAGNTYSRVWIIAADGGAYDRDDAFKLSAIKLRNLSVPEPATWMTMIVGFGVAGTALRRSRRDQRKAIAA
jgi:hypothetical protein